MNKNKLIRILGIAIMLAAFAFLIKKFLSFGIDYNQLLSKRYITALVYSTLFAVIIIACNAYCWRSSIAIFSEDKVNLFAAYELFSKANLGKYVPGNVGHYAARQVFGASIGLRQSQLAVASFLEIGYNALSAIIVSAAFAYNTIIGFLREYIAGSSQTLLLVIGFSAIIVIVVAVVLLLKRNKTVLEISGYLKKPVFWLTFLRNTAFNCVLYLLFAVGMIMFLRISAAPSASEMLMTIAAVSAATLIGFITPGVPGGIGVREAVLVFLLSSVYPQEVILTSAVMHRFAMILGDVLAALIGILCGRLSSRNAERNK